LECEHRCRYVSSCACIANIKGNSYIDSTVAANSTYVYSVIAVDASGNISNPSAAAQVTAPGLPVTDTKAPSVPGSPKATAVVTSQITIMWNASSDDTGIKAYYIYRSSDGGKTFGKIAGVTKTSYGDSKVKENASYTYYIVALDTEGNKSAPSSKVSATTKKLSSTKQQLIGEVDI
jgi:fibronectin type 3 domain-containing protein